MFLLGNCYFREDSIAAIAPAHRRQAEFASDVDLGYNVHLIGGTVFHVDVDADEVRRVLINLGIVKVQPPVSVELTADKIDKLNKALADGFRYIARDKNQQVFAYVKKPTKGSGQWDQASGDANPLRIKGDFSWLSWEDDEPTEIALLLGYSPLGV